ncbi:MAG: UDP-N-acetylglucosamine 2-epimerase (non-hydrolyzing) [Gemmatimonadales bacterium]
MVGTRPEAIKMAPVVRELGRRSGSFEPVVITTSQQREMLAQALAAFDLDPDVDLGLTHTNRTLAQFTAQALLALTNGLQSIRPDLLMVQGDTSTVVAAALAAFYNGIPIGHVEAGLRSGDLRRPFPEEANRRMATAVTDLHFAPTERARQNLLVERVPDRDIVVTGNTIVDAIRSIRSGRGFTEPALERIDWEGRRVVLVTTHRRESLGDSLHGVCRALKHLVNRHPDLQLVFPVHLNPKVQEVVLPELDGHDRIALLPPLDYGDVVEVMRRSVLILTDSGGIQEEAPSVETPVVILREVTERPEVVESGFGVLVGTDPDRIVATVDRLLVDEAARQRMTSGPNPFGDGRASERIADALLDFFARRDRFPEPAAVAEPVRHAMAAPSPRSGRAAALVAALLLAGTPVAAQGNPFGRSWFRVTAGADRVSAGYDDWASLDARTATVLGSPGPLRRSPLAAGLRRRGRLRRGRPSPRFQDRLARHGHGRRRVGPVRVARTPRGSGAAPQAARLPRRLLATIGLTLVRSKDVYRDRAALASLTYYW